MILRQFSQWKSSTVWSRASSLCLKSKDKNLSAGSILSLTARISLRGTLVLVSDKNLGFKPDRLRVHLFIISENSGCK